LLCLAAVLTSAIAILMLSLTPRAAEAAVSVNLSSLNDATAVSASSLTTFIAAIAIVLYGAAIRSRHH
jgi:hypothetical protein